MGDNTVELIRRILSGDDEAFTLLIRKTPKVGPCPCLAEDRGFLYY